MSAQLDMSVALAQYEQRKARNAGVEQVNNASLRAGSPMHYYCKHCGDKTAVLPEGHWERPKTACGPCNVLATHGLVP